MVTGGGRDGAVHAATVVADVDPTMRIFRDELFGPAVGGHTDRRRRARRCGFANDSDYGLCAGVFTQDIDVALRFAREVDTGNVHHQRHPDLARRPHAVRRGQAERRREARARATRSQEMTEVKTVVFQER